MILVRIGTNALGNKGKGLTIVMNTLSLYSLRKHGEKLDEANTSIGGLKSYVQRHLADNKKLADKIKKLGEESDVSFYPASSEFPMTWLFMNVWHIFQAIKKDVDELQVRISKEQVDE